MLKPSGRSLAFIALQAPLDPVTKRRPKTTVEEMDNLRQKLQQKLRR